MNQLPRREPALQEAPGPTRRSPAAAGWNLVQMAVVALTVAMLVAEVFMYAPPLRPSQMLSVALTDVQGRVTVNSSLWASYTGSFRQVYGWGSNPPPVRTLYYYFDPNYPTAGVGYVSWVGLPYHIQEVLGYRGSTLRVVILDAAQLATFLANLTTAADGLLVVASGALPDTVFTNSTNLVTPWLQQGGRLVWLGAFIGFYVAEPLDSPDGPLLIAGLPGVSQFVRTSMIGGPREYDNATTMSAALNMNFAAGFPGFGFAMAAVARVGGEVVGNQAEGYTNGALLPMAAGLLIALVGGIDTPMENDLATSIVNMIQFGLAGGPVQVLGQRDISVPAGNSVRWSETVVLPPGNPTGRRFCIFTHQVDATAFFANVTCL